MDFSKYKLSRRTMLLSGAGAAGAAALGAGAIGIMSPAAAPVADSGKVTLYRDPGCGCCESYVEYLKRQGFDVTVKPASPDEISAMSRKAGIPADLEGCHTAFIDGYVVDGLVPVAAVRKLLKDRPPLKGITLPGMPQGAPGMTGAKEGTLTVYAIPKEGKPSVFMTF